MVTWGQGGAVSVGQSTAKGAGPSGGTWAWRLVHRRGPVAEEPDARVVQQVGPRRVPHRGHRRRRCPVAGRRSTL